MYQDVPRVDSGMIFIPQYQLTMWKTHPECRSFSEWLSLRPGSRRSTAGPWPTAVAALSGCRRGTLGRCCRGAAELGFQHAAWCQPKKNPITGTNPTTNPTTNPITPISLLLLPFNGLMQMSNINDYQKHTVWVYHGLSV